MWLEFYGLNKQPFGVTPDPNFLYMGPAHQEAFASMVYGVETGRGFMALVAAPGMGKTTLLLKLMEKLRDTAITAYLFQVHTNSQEFLKNLLLDLDVQPVGNDLSDLQRQVREVLIQSSDAGKRLVLVIDEAQNLDDSVLEMVRMLSNFETPQAKLLQTILVGQPALADKLARPRLSQLRQRISIIAHFSPLRSEEIAEYIGHRLRIAGYKGGRLFTPAAMELIVKFSGGIPRVINNLCFNSMSLSYAKGRRKIDENILREVIADLSLEGFGDKRPNARFHTSKTTSTREKGKRPRTEARAHPNSSPDSWMMSDEFLDTVDLSGRGSGWAAEPSWSPSSAPQYRPASGHKSSFSAALLFLLATAAISFWAWRVEWLRPSVDFVVQAAENALNGPEKQNNSSLQNRPNTALREGGAGIQRSPGEVGAAGETNQFEVKKNDSPEAADHTASGPPENTPSTGAQDSGVEKIPSLSEEADPNHLSARAKERKINSSGRHDFADDLGAQGEVGMLVVESTLSGAQIKINGRNSPKWVTPHIFKLVAGTYIVSVSRGLGMGWTRRVHVDRGVKNWVMADLKYDEGRGIFIVETDPEGLQVFIDGKPYGASRVATTLPPGWHDYKVEVGQGLPAFFGHFHLKAGEALTRKVHVTPGEPSAIPTPSARLRPQGAGEAVSNSTTDGGGIP